MYNCVPHCHIVFFIAMAQKLVDDFIANNKVMVFSKSYCPYCSMAKSAFDQTGVTYKTLELDERGRQ